MTAIVQADVLLKIVAATLVGGVGITGIFGLVILSATRFDDSRRAMRPRAAGVYGAVTVVALAAFFASVILGLIVVFTK